MRERKRKEGRREEGRRWHYLSPLDHPSMSYTLCHLNPKGRDPTMVFIIPSIITETKSKKRYVERYVEMKRMSRRTIKI